MGLATAASTRAFWDRQKLAVEPWTAHSTMTAAKAAHANGMPEPPDIFFETQDRIIEFFQKNGTRHQYNPGDVLLDIGSQLSTVMIIEEGSVRAQKTINKLKRKEDLFGESPLQERLALAKEGLSKKKRERKLYRESRQLQTDDAEQWSRCSIRSEEEDADATRDLSPAAPGGKSATFEPYEGETVTISTLEKDEMLGQMSFIEAGPNTLRYVADTEGAAVLKVPTDMFVAELERDQMFAGACTWGLSLHLGLRPVSEPCRECVQEHRHLALGQVRGDLLAPRGDGSRGVVFMARILARGAREALTEGNRYRLFTHSPT
ncbi:MAG: hypothetical protein SGPRY_000779 [Prymnesium sp.]